MRVIGDKIMKSFTTGAVWVRVFETVRTVCLVQLVESEVFRVAKSVGEAVDFAMVGDATGRRGLAEGWGRGIHT